MVLLLAVIRQYPEESRALVLAFIPYATGTQLRTLMWAVNRTGMDVASFSRAVVATYGVDGLVRYIDRAKDTLWLLNVRRQLADVLADITPEVRVRLDTLQVILLPFDASSEWLISRGILRPTYHQLNYFFATHVIHDVAQFERFARAFDLSEVLRHRYALKLPTWELLLYVIDVLQAGGAVGTEAIDALAIRFNKKGDLYAGVLSTTQKATLEAAFTDKVIRQRLSMLIRHLQLLKLID